MKTEKGELPTLSYLVHATLNRSMDESDRSVHGRGSG